MAIEKKKIIIVGCGPGAEDYITPAARAAAGKADVLIVSKRLHDLFPEIAAERIDSGTDIAGTLETIASRRDAGRQVVLLATGDPGIASLAQPVIRRFGRENCEVIPGISSIQVAFARLGLDWKDVRIVTAHSRDPELAAADLREAGKLAILGGRDGAIRWAAGLIPQLGKDRRVFLCEDLTLPGEKIREIRAGELAGLPVSTRAIILVIRGELLS
ncbi:MAG: precorrin-6y C5,15-methyltransferase (decarboxylating) subunit CbiE [Proteobacteria bacterium]|nr:precorrin-6y C5,15-methyltransferase (decarboxylating) subunit CbiE [Pseudomonadota bacterium]MBU2227083.1 precorrin-6y C5,15-methyltransferase (decarboxylating) subunit CbiE [Pseudomonadota bacterium]MBU2262289.1 precorrin-6y C5,15-methyltransferase (decarboxylating) subunit CbiE [Pseudomonadota bacterium]